jgi:hypothetical protein
MEVAGISLPVIEAHCQYLRPARYDDEIEVKTEGRMLSPVRMEFQYQVVRKDDPDDRRGGQDRCTRRSTRRAGRVGCRSACARSSHEGARHRRGGLHRSHLAETLLDGGATVIALDCFSDYYPRAIKEANST